MIRNPLDAIPTTPKALKIKSFFVCLVPKLMSLSA